MLMWRRQPLRAGNFADETGPSLDADWSPALDILESAEEFLLVLSVPGVRPDDLELAVSGRIVTVAGHRDIHLTEGFTAHLLESPQGRFLRRIRFPLNRDMEAIGTNLRDGQLVIRVSKSECVSRGQSPS